MKQKSGFVPTVESVDRPDNFQTNEVWNSKIFKAGLAGAIIGAFLFAFFGFLLASGSIGAPWADRFVSGGNVVIFSAATAGVIISGLFGSLIGLFNRG